MMTPENRPMTPVMPDAMAPAVSQGSYLDWPAIFAGAIIALALSFLLISFGTSVGLSLTSPYRGEGVSAAWMAIAAGIWFAWVMVTGFGAGGYLAGRMRRRAGDATEDEVAVRDGAHGLMVWATGALVSSVIAAAGAGGLLGVGASVLGSATGAATDVASDVASSDYFANLMLRNTAVIADPDESVAPDVASSDESGNTPATGGTNTGAPPRSDGSTPPPSQAGTTGPAIDPAIQQQVTAILARSAASGEMAERDSIYLAQLVAANSDLDEDAARARVDEVNAEIAEARAAAVDAVEQARVAGVVFGFIAAATLLAGAVAAFFAASLGGRHRDEGLASNTLVARR